MKKANIVTIVVLIILFAIIIGIQILLRKNSMIKEQSEFNEIEIVSDNTTFFSVSSNINKLYNYYNDNNNEKLYSILNSSYIEQNNLNKENLLLNFNSLDSKAFGAKEIYVVSKINLYKYYVYGYEKNNSMDELGYIMSEKYYILNLDINTRRFNIELIDESEYTKATTRKKFNFDLIQKNNHNIFEYLNVNDQTIATIYFNEYKNNLMHNPEYIYERISLGTKEKYFSTIDKFNNYIKDNTEEILNSSVTEYTKSGPSYLIVDNYKNEYTFRINKIMDYTISIKFPE